MTVQKSGVSRFISFEKLMLLFSKDAINLKSDSKDIYNVTKYFGFKPFLSF